MLRMLLIEDNPADIELAREAFEGSGMEILIARDGVEALESLRRAAETHQALPDLILVDLNLPRLDGRQVIEKLKRDPSLSHIPAIVLSSSEALTDINESYERGANCYLKKPADFVAFQDLVRAIKNFWFKSARLPRRVIWSRHG